MRYAAVPLPTVPDRAFPDLASVHAPHPPRDPRLGRRRAAPTWWGYTLVLCLLSAVLAMTPPALAADDDRVTVEKSGDSGLSVGGSTTTTVVPPGASAGNSGGGASPGGAQAPAPPDRSILPQLEENVRQNCAQSVTGPECTNALTELLACQLVCEDPTPQAAPQLPVAQPEPITLTATDVQHLMVSGNGLTRQPGGPEALVTKPVIAYTSDDPQTLTTTVAGTQVTVTATPSSYRWEWGDATADTTTDPGAPWPHHTVEHTYASTATDVTITLTTTWTATWSLPDGTTHDLDGTLTTTDTAEPFDLVRPLAYLTDDAEHAQGH
ncbi:zinc transporter [Actinomyces wuliandei]|uniref:zinc transporter n=1 Tax=Actinomyces wuliandei TaxID=2057743 RepID=UPI00214ADD96|nr:zinc transporter [Actinomyces wuliandei]